MNHQQSWPSRLQELCGTITYVGWVSIFIFKTRNWVLKFLILTSKRMLNVWKQDWITELDMTFLWCNSKVFPSGIKMCYIWYTLSSNSSSDNENKAWGRERKSPLLLDQQQQIDHFHCHVWVLVQHHAENSLLNTHRHLDMQWHINRILLNHANRHSVDMHNAPTSTDIHAHTRAPSLGTKPWHKYHLSAAAHVA